MPKACVLPITDQDCVTEMDAKLRSTWTTKAAQAGHGPTASMSASAIAALPVLPTLFSTASAETRRSEQAASEATNPAYESSSHTSGETDAAVPVLPARQIAPTLPSDPSNTATAPVRISDLAPTKGENEDGQACRSGDPASTDAGQGLSRPGEGQDRSAASQKGAQDQGAPLPHCSIEFDPDADDSEVVAHAPKASTTPTKAAAAQAAATIEAAAKQADKVPDAAQANAAQADAAAATAETAAAIAVATSTTSPASDAPLLVTDATKGVGSAVIDPALPTNSVVFASDMPPMTLPDSPATPTPDVLAQALSMPGAILPPVPLFDHLLIG
ncbi:hypothetical protein [Elioraea sp.]|uniref:hypothetical protein n=1 Tax=Elioraea sp. TaxID=2185103 RepID=UPI0025C5C78D|nr:hypothetical protein [Elioraea sp.]